MSAVLAEQPVVYRPMHLDDLALIIDVERRIYPFPWTFGNFRDSLNAGYSCWVGERAGDLTGYGVLMVAAGEGHVLNLGIAEEWQGRGLGRMLLEHLMEVARGYRVEVLFLEVRTSNLAARRLYARAGFDVIAIRRNYYPAHDGREDAVIMGKRL